jgi:hypothetical protein
MNALATFVAASDIAVGGVRRRYRQRPSLVWRQAIAHEHKPHIKPEVWALCREGVKLCFREATAFLAGIERLVGQAEQRGNFLVCSDIYLLLETQPKPPPAKAQPGSCATWTSMASG